MKSKLIIAILLALSFMALPFLFADNVSDRRVIIVHGIRQDSQSMEPMKDMLVEMGIPEENIELVDLPKNQGLIEKNAQYLGNYIKDTYEQSGRKKAIVIGYSMGGLAADFLVRNQEENVMYSYQRYPDIAIPTPFGDIEYNDITKVETVVNDVQMPIHMEKYINEVIMVGSGPSRLAWLLHDKSRENEDWAVYQQLIPGSDFLRRLDSMDPNPSIVYNTISGTDTGLIKENDDIVSNIYSQRDYAENNYMVAGVTHTELYKNLEVVKLAFNEIANGSFASKDAQVVLEYKKAKLELERNLKKAALSRLMTNAPCGAKTKTMTTLSTEISSIEQQISAIDVRINSQ